MNKKNMDLFEDACCWAIKVLQSTSIGLYGGYYGSCYKYKDAVFILDPGNESPKYAKITAYKIKKLLKVYKKYLKDNDDYDYYDILDEIEMGAKDGFI